MRHGSATEYVILGALMPGEKHGYELMQFLASALEATWQVSTSQLYVLLKRLDRQGWLGSRAEPQVVRPSKRVFYITPEGRSKFVEWVKQPVHHVRDLRMEFLCKLFFLDHLALEGGKELVDGQVAVLQELLKKIQEEPRRDESSFMEVVYGFKARSVECMLHWLKQEVVPFVSCIKVVDSKEDPEPDLP
jgi:DNA-binding PadR family transcriptional regulator